MGERKLRVLIVDDSTDFTEMTSSYLNGLDCTEVVGVAYNGRDGLTQIGALAPDVVILDMVMPHLDGIGVLEALNQEAPDTRPAVIAVTGCSSDAMDRQVFELGVNYLMLKPFEMDSLGSRLRRIGGANPRGQGQQGPERRRELGPGQGHGFYPERRRQDRRRELGPGQGHGFYPERRGQERKQVSGAAASRRSLEYEVTDILHQAGIPPHIKGYQYLRDAILLVTGEINLLGAVTKELYPMIAEKYGTTPSRVERAIRHAIELARDRANPALMSRYSGYGANWKKGKPANSEFIAMIADGLRLGLMAG